MLTGKNLMDETNTELRRPGRKMKEAGKPKTGTMTFRVRAGMREKLQASAEIRGLSISEEVERRLDLSLDMSIDPFKSIALRMIVDHWKYIDALLGRKRTADDPLIYARAAKKAVEKAIDIASDPNLMKALSGERIAAFYRGLIEEPNLSAIRNQNEGNVEAASDYAAEGMVDAGIFNATMDAPPAPKLTKAEREEKNKVAAARKAETSKIGTLDPSFAATAHEMTPDEVAASDEAAAAKPRRKRT